MESAAPNPDFEYAFGSKAFKANPELIGLMSPEIHAVAKLN